MIILFIGNFDHPFCTEVHHKLTFEKLGHEVIAFQENRSNINDIIAQVDLVDMLYWTHTHSFRLGRDEEVTRMLALYKEKGVPTVGYHLDLFLGIEREKTLHTDPYWDLQHFFTVDKLMADWLNANTKTKGYYLPAGVFEDECYMAKPDRERYPHEIVFTGSLGYHKEYPYRQKLIGWLHSTYGNRFAHYGGGGLPSLRGHELNTLYASAKIVIGDTLCKNFDYPYYFSDRFFEVPGRGGFMIAPNIQGIEELYVPGKEIILYEYNDMWELKLHIDAYLEAHDSREEIRYEGHQRAKSEHTYTNRLQTIFNTLKL